MILEALGQALQIFTIKASDPSRMDQANMLGEPRSWIHYNVKPGLPDPAGRRATYDGHPPGGHSRETPAPHLCCFGRTAPEKHRDPGRDQGCLGGLERQVFDRTTANPMNRHIVS